MSTAPVLVGDAATGAGDTSPATEALMIAGFRHMAGWRKLDHLRRLNTLGLALTMASVRERHPAAGERECLLRLAARCMEPGVLRELCGWDVEVEGY